MRKMKENMVIALRFCTVGASNTLVDFGVFFLLITIGIQYLLAQICSYAAGMANSYVWNRVWTFQVKQQADLKEMFRFIVLNAAASVFTFLLLYFLQESRGLSLFSSKVAATIGGMVITFIGSRLWVFKDEVNKEVG